MKEFLVKEEQGPYLLIQNPKYSSKNLNKYYIFVLIIIIILITFQIKNKENRNKEKIINFKNELNEQIKEKLNNDTILNELKNQLKEELKNQLKEESKNLLKEDLTIQAKEQFKNQLKEELKSQLKEEIKSQTKEELKNKLKQEIKSQTKEELKSQLKEELKSQLKQEEKNQIKEELKSQLKEELKSQLKEEFKNQIKEYVKDEALIKPKVCLCAIGKKENRYALEFVNYYKNLGYNHIFIYDNNDVNDERFEDVLSKEISDNFVSIIDYRGFRGQRNKPQFDAYYDCYKKNSEEYDWLSFYDFDEFLELKNNSNIQEFLSEEKFNKCINIKINWMIYSDNDLVYYENKPVQERFTQPLPNDSDNKHIKSTVRGHLKGNYWEKIANPHTSQGNYASCIPTGQQTDSNSPFHTPPNYKYAYIRHYGTKTIEEYIVKIKRGRAAFGYKLDEKEIRQRLNYFFGRNKKTKEKLDLIKKELNITFN